MHILCTKQNIRSQRVYPNYYKQIFTVFFLIVFKNEWEEHKIWRQKKKCGFYKNKVFHTDDIDVNKIQY